MNTEQEAAKSEHVNDVSPKKQNRHTRVIVLILFLFLMISGVIGWKYTAQNSGPIPKQIVNDLNFKPYYPSVLPQGYTHKKGSENIKADVLFFVIHNGDEEVIISQQKVPEIPPDLGAIIDFKQAETTAGKTAIGITDGKASAVLVSTTTLVTVTGSKDTPNDVVASLINSMASLPDTN